MGKRSCWLSLALAAICGCDSHGLTHKSVEDTCARISACGPSDLEGMSFGECVQLMGLLDLGMSQANLSTSSNRLTKAFYECILSASNCDEMQACSRPTSEQLALCDSAKDDVCSGDVAVKCSREGERVTALDCARAGLVCGVGMYGAWCGLAACDPDTTTARCEGDTLFACDRQGNVLVSRDCSENGDECGKKADGTMGCVGKVACDTSKGDMYCEGTVEVDCWEGRASRSDCSKLGADWTCEVKKEEGGSSMSCVPISKDCTIGANETCAQGVISYCAGRPATYDCKSAGLSGCAINTKKKIAGCVK